jgi:hypothetical protein
MPISINSNAITWTEGNEVTGIISPEVINTLTAGTFSGVVNTNGIADNAVTNLKIAGPIDGTKITPNFGNQDILTTGKLLSPNGSAFFGTVSNSDNGAIMEYGINANGQFIKYANGVVICWSNYFLDFLANNLTAQDQTIIYPAQINHPSGDFVHLYISLSRNDYTVTTSKIMGFFSGVDVDTSLSFVAKAWNLNSTAHTSLQTRSFRYLAIGSWT